MSWNEDLSRDPYTIAVCKDPGAPYPRFAPFTADVRGDSINGFRAMIISSRGVPILEDKRRWPDRRRAQLEADAMRIWIIAAFHRKERR